MRGVSKIRSTFEGDYRGFMGFKVVSQYYGYLLGLPIIRIAVCWV